MPKKQQHKRHAKTRRAPRSHPQGIIAISASGHGSVHTAEGDFFIPASRTSDAFDGDMVEVCRIAPVDNRGSQRAARIAGMDQAPAGRVVRVIERAHESLVGRYEVAEPFGIVVPEDIHIMHDIFTLRSEAPQVQDGDIVKVRITGYPNRNQPATGVVEEVLGHGTDKGIGVELIIARHKLETKFSEATLQQVADARVDAAGALEAGYRDLRDRCVFTIDPVDARDFDDALSLDKVEGGWRLGVHIADVSHYVPWGSSVDLDARRRATSVYLVDRVIPMLPEALSNDLCSLRPNEDRRSMTVDLFFDGNWNLRYADVYPALIRSCQRLSYDQVQEHLDGRAPLAPEVGERLITLNAMAKALHEQRYRRGGIDFESVEAKVVLDDDGNPVDVNLRTKTDATALVEEAMIAANEAVARFLRDAGCPGVYRTHEAPDGSELAMLVPILQEFNYDRVASLDRFALANPKAIQAVLAAAAGRPEEFLVSSLVLRSMKRAVYQPECEPHFGLASDAYTHFTSPIRRYPDLIVHRMCKTVIGKRSGTYQQQVDSLAWLSEHSSKMERIAEAASRESQELKLMELLSAHVGEAYDGIISGVTTSGFFVKLDNTAEGFVNLGRRGEYFILDVERRLLRGSDTDTVFRLGQPVRVRIAAVRPYERQADFSLLD